MSGAAIRRGESRLPALAVAAALHAALIAWLAFFPAHPDLPIGSSVPINIVSSAPFTDTRPAVEAPETETAAAPSPSPQAPPQPPAAQVAPPAFSRASPTPIRTQREVPPQPSRRPSQAAAKPLDLNHLQQIIDDARRSSSQAASSAQRGPARAETAPQARPDAGLGVSESDMLGLQQLLERLWNPNCDVAGGAAVKLRVKFLVGLSGNLIGAPSAGGLERSPDPVVSAAALRALDAVREAAPYPSPYYGQSIVVNFDAKEACAKR
jgi:hypothetical protein